MAGFSTLPGFSISTTSYSTKCCKAHHKTLESVCFQGSQLFEFLYTQDSFIKWIQTLDHLYETHFGTQWRSFDTSSSPSNRSFFDFFRPNDYWWRLVAWQDMTRLWMKMMKLWLIWGSWFKKAPWSTLEHHRSVPGGHAMLLPKHWPGGQAFASAESRQPFEFNREPKGRALLLGCQ